MIDHIIGDKNCMFWSLSKELFGTQCHHLELRKLILNFEEHNPNIIRSLSNDKVQLHLDRIRQESEWGSATELVALASMLQVPVFTFTNSASHTYSNSWHGYSPLQLEDLSFQLNPALKGLAKRFTNAITSNCYTTVHITMTELFHWPFFAYTTRNNELKRRGSCC